MDPQSHLRGNRRYNTGPGRARAIAPSDKARVLAEGISSSMYRAASGIVVSGVALIPIAIFAVRLYRDSKHDG